MAGRLLAALLCMALVAGCGGGGGKRPAASGIIELAAKKTAAVKSFRFTLDVKGVPPSVTGISLEHADGQLVVPDRLKARVSGTFARLPIESELVIVAGKDYFKDPLTGRWRTLDIATNPIGFFDPAKGVLAVIQGAQHVAVTGSETVGGTESYHLTGKVKAVDASRLLAVETRSDRLVDLELWIGEADSLLRRVRVDGTVAEGEPADASRTVELSDFGKAFQIAAPEVTG